MLSYKLLLKFRHIAYNIIIFFFILFMATLKPKSIQDVLATSPQAVPTMTPVSSTKAQNQAQLELNKQKAAAKQDIRNLQNQPATWMTTSWYVMDERDSGNWYINKWVQYQAVDQAGNISIWKDKWTAEAGLNQYGWVASTDIWVNPLAYAKSTKPSSSVSTGNKLQTFWDLNDTKTPKTNVGRITSDALGALRDSKWDRASFDTSINYAGLTDEEKKKADMLFNNFSTSLKKQEEKRMKDPTYAYTKTLTEWEKATLEQNKKDTKEELEAKKQSKEKLDTFVSSENAIEENAFNTFETTQNDLLRNYEGNRLNQVQGNLRRALLNRWVDVSKIPQEQLIALSGEIGAQAFSDISAAKERAVNAIETARQNKIAKVRQLNAQKVLSDQQYEEAVADINSKSAALDTNTKLKFAETVFWLQTTKEAQDKTEKQNAVQNALSTAQALWVKGSQFGVVSDYLNKATSADAINTMVSSLNDPASPLYTILKSNEDAASKAAQFENQIKLMEAQAKLISASKSDSSGWWKKIAPNEQPKWAN